MADIRVVSGNMNKAIMHGNKQIGYIDEDDGVWMFGKRDTTFLDRIDHPSEAVKLVDEWLKRH